MQTSNIFKLNKMPTYNKHNHYYQLSVTNSVRRKEVKQNRKENYIIYIFKRELILFFQPIIC